MNSVKDERPLTHHAKFLIRELLTTFDCMEEEDLDNKDLKEAMSKLSWILKDNWGPVR